jgi:hypothetical protein
MAKTTELVAPTTAELTAQFINKCEELRTIAQQLVADQKKDTNGELILGNGRFNLTQTALRVAKRRADLIEPYFPVANLEDKINFYSHIATYTGHLDAVYTVLELKRSDIGKDILWYAYRIADILSLKAKFDDEARTEFDELTKVIKDLVGTKTLTKKTSLDAPTNKN